MSRPDPETQSRAELASEVKGLRSRLNVLRAERTAMAGKKYALDVVVESLRERIEALAEAFGEGDQARVRRLLDEAREIGAARASGVGALGLESERLAQLEAMQALEQRTGELQEEVVGLRTECEALRSQVGGIDREREELATRLEALEGGRLKELEAAAQELARLRAQALGQLDQLARAAGALGQQLGALRASLAE